MEVDPIADNQTAVVIAELMTRKDGDITLSHAVAALLAHAQKSAREIQDIKDSLWSPSALDERIDSRFRELMKAENEARSAANKGSAWRLLFSKDGLLVFVVVLFALMAMYVIIGKEGYSDVTHTVHTIGVQGNGH